MGSPLSAQNLKRDLVPVVDNASAQALASQVTSDGSIYINVENDGYFPQTLRAKANTPIKLNLVTDRTYSCARDFVIPALGYYELLPNTGMVQVDVPAQPSGTRLFFTCSMGMYTGMIVFE